MAISYDPYLPPLPPSPREHRRANRRWRRADWLVCLLIWLAATLVLIRLIEIYSIPLPGR